MANFPMNIIELGHFDLTDYQLLHSFLLGADLELTFAETGNHKRGFIIKLFDLVAFNDWTRNNKISMLRIDKHGSSFGLDIALRLKNDEYCNYNLLYLFEDIKHTLPIFRGLAKSISIHNFDNTFK